MELKIRLAKSIEEIGQDQWRRLESPDFPFNDFEFFQALEQSQCVGKGTGWQTIYVICEDEQNKICGILYAFVKHHSYGEYIFDWQWANFYQAHGVDYYPKLLTAVPFTPATGPRILVDPEADRDLTRNTLIQAALQISEQSNLSSYHTLFIENEERDAFERAGMVVRHSIQYHWRNRGYRHFQDFIDSLVGKRRRDIVRERQRANSHGLTISQLTGDDLKPEHALIMESLYQTTTDKKNATAYLKPEFFDEIFRTMKDRILLVLATKDGEPVAGALNFYKGKKLYGRYWGSHAHYADLHFELCYYQTIDFALARGIETFEAGAQGEHKVQRGFMPSLTYSAHRIFDSRFGKPIDDFVQEEREALKSVIQSYSNPFRSEKDSNF